MAQINSYKDITLLRMGKLNFRCNSQSTSTALNTAHNSLSYLTHKQTNKKHADCKHHITFSVALGDKYQHERNTRHTTAVLSVTVNRAAATNNNSQRHTAASLHCS